MWSLFKTFIVSVVLCAAGTFVSAQARISAVFLNEDGGIILRKVSPEGYTARAAISLSKLPTSRAQTIATALAQVSSPELQIIQISLKPKRNNQDKVSGLVGVTVINTSTGLQVRPIQPGTLDPITLYGLLEFWNYLESLTTEELLNLAPG